MIVTPEIIEALRKLRNASQTPGEAHQRAMRRALDILENAGVFAAIDEATGYDVELQVGSAEWHEAMGEALAKTPLYAHRQQATCK